MMLRTKKNYTFADIFVRGVAQLVARYVRDVEAASSSLVTPTSFLMCCVSAFYKTSSYRDYEYM